MVLILNTFDKLGGAALAARRILLATRECGVDSNMLVQKAFGNDEFVAEAHPGNIGQYAAKIREYTERLRFMQMESSSKVRFYFSMTSYGQDISKHPWVKKADIFHPNWINKGYLSAAGLEKLAATGKPFVWTLHDSWAFTGGCHLPGDCTHFTNGCGNCWYLKNKHDKDLSTRILQRKQLLYDKMPKLTFVTPSQWLADVAKGSKLLGDRDIRVIPNPIDTDMFSPGDKRALKAKLNLDPDSLVLLFVSMSLRDHHKGFTYLKKSLEHLQSSGRPYELLVVGNPDPESTDSLLPFKTRYLGRLDTPKDMVEAYSAADVFLTPSLADNLPNTVMESLACGTPVVAFKTGGIPEMVTHLQEGYIATQRDEEDFARGILWVTDSVERLRGLSIAAREKALAAYSMKAVGGKYRALYEGLI